MSRLVICKHILNKPRLIEDIASTCLLFIVLSGAVHVKENCPKTLLLMFLTPQFQENGISRISFNLNINISDAKSDSLLLLYLNVKYKNHSVLLFGTIGSFLV